MDEIFFVFATAGVITAYFLAQVVTRRFDPFAPVWLFLVGYVQVYVVQALSYHDWAVDVRGKELVTAANFRSFWAVLWFLAVYHLGLGRRVAPALPRPPRGWSSGLVDADQPASGPLGTVLRRDDDQGGLQGLESVSPEESSVSVVPVRDDGGGDLADRDRAGLPLSHGLSSCRPAC